MKEHINQLILDLLPIKYRSTDLRIVEYQQDVFFAIATDLVPMKLVFNVEKWDKNKWKFVSRLPLDMG